MNVRDRQDLYGVGILVIGVMTSLAVLCFVAFVSMGCGPIQPVPPRNPDAGDPEDCVAACDNLTDLGCDGADGSAGSDEVYGTEDDVPCAEVCEVLMEGDNTFTAYPLCLARAESCAEADDCSLIEQ